MVVDLVSGVPSTGLEGTEKDAPVVGPRDRGEGRRVPEP